METPRVLTDLLYKIACEIVEKASCLKECKVVEFNSAPIKPDYDKDRALCIGRYTDNIRLHLYIVGGGIGGVYRFWAGIKGQTRKKEPEKGILAYIDNLPANIFPKYFYEKDTTTEDIPSERLGQVAQEKIDKSWHWIGFTDRHDAQLESAHISFIDSAVGFFVMLSASTVISQSIVV